MQGSGDLNAVVNGKPGTFAALASHQRTGLVNGEEQRDMTAASLNGGRHAFTPHSVG